MIREIVLQQNAYHPVDTFCPMKRQYQVMKTIYRFADLSKRAVEMDVLVDTIANMPLRTRLGKSKFEENVDSELDEINRDMDKAFEALGGK
jgi:V/A-type H+-transporting ATPase subunit A